MTYANAHVRIARPSTNLQAAERFWVEGLGLDVLWRVDPATDDHTEYALLMVGWTDAAWHLELADHPGEPVKPTPTDEDLLVIYLNGPVPDELVERLERCGGRRVTARNPYWDEWGVTIEDPDGYRLVLSTRDWG
ncbi:VOC family protein [Stackebrandtia nassauensis]|uniref:Glyoxalase/bleomycin resistance protein/dioxygenase n=1 Tax=Stackebrandtia nassauensis (strain DSM 44728 / CIP 108903 / NRRL B-16338 / NBRC 102104 / LLR-40K-21) TaxID=446470 RepID=D3Q9A9_STANL|nr:VOC family protein [Stackebrandtia nassauensis]ADD42591.1 Glyoxalase/bleomycin resistance protein/dioxygenase [Stackebrandtia nassauensis DSM 44728]